MIPIATFSRHPFIMDNVLVLHSDQDSTVHYRELILIHAVSVMHCDGKLTPLKGFLLQGRQLVDDTTPLGTFNIIDPNSRMSDCDQPEVCLTPTSA